MEKSGVEVKAPQDISPGKKNDLLGEKNDLPGEKNKPAKKELSSKQKKIWASALFGTGILIVGLIVAIVVVINIRPPKEKECTTIDDLTEEEVEEYRQQVAIAGYTKIQEAIAKVLDASVDKGQETVVSTYQYYISQTDNTIIRNMLRSELLNIEMAYDTEKTRGDELIVVAIEIDDEIQTINSAGLIMILAEYYDKTDIYNKYAGLLEERTIAKGMTMDGEGEG